MDSYLAELYGVETRVLKQDVRRNKKRVPDDFMLEPTKEENRSLRSQNVILKLMASPGKPGIRIDFEFKEPKRGCENK